MLVQALTSIPSPIHPQHSRCFSRDRLYAEEVYPGVIGTRNGRARNQGILFCANEERSPNAYASRKRKVLEHICLIKGKEDLSQEEETDMLDYLYTSQYQMRGILAISLGRLSEKSNTEYTHAVFMRFQRKEDIIKFYENSYYKGVLREHVMPYCHGLIYVDYESEVEDDILPIFRKGEEFNFGVEFVLLIAFVDNAIDASVEDALDSLEKLTVKFPSLIVQHTQGMNINVSSKEYTHGVVIRFRSPDAFEIFMNNSEYMDIWRSKFQKITKKALCVHYSVDPVGTEIM